MLQEQRLKEIARLFATLATYIQADNAMGLYDKNRVAEDVLVPVLAEIYDYQALKNLNEDVLNFPGIDLGDEDAKVAVQISSNVTGKKVTDTLQTFVKFKHYEKFEHLLIYDLVSKQASYLGTDWDDIIDNKFVFSKENDILDYRDLLKKIAPLSPEKLEVIQKILEKYVGQSLIANLDSKHQLRSALPDFTDREAIIEEIKEAVLNQGKQIVGLFGMGGIGKTELALSLAHELQPHFPDTQIVITLQTGDGREKTEVEVITDILHSILGFETTLPKEENELRGLLRSKLNKRKVILLVDNVYRREQIAPLVPIQDGLVILTSRAALAQPGIFNVQVDVLPREEAKRLLQRIANHISDDVADRICVLCGDLPLAIRAAGSMLAVTPDLDPINYAESLKVEKTRLELLGTEGIDLSVEASFRVSYEGLDDQSAKVFRQLAHFPESFNSEAEEQICEDSSHAALSNLLRRSLVIYDSRKKRYKLHELVRLFAKSLQSPEETVMGTERFIRHFGSLVSMSNHFYLMHGDSRLKGIQMFNYELANVRAGFERIKSISQIQRQADLASNYLSSGAQIMLSQLTPQELSEWAQYNLDISKQANNIFGVAISTTILGLTYRDLGRFKESEQFIQESLELSEKAGDKKMIAHSYNYLGEVLYSQGRSHSAIEAFVRSKTIFCELGLHSLEGEPMSGLGLVYSRIGDTNKAVYFLDLVVKFAREDGDKFAEANGLANLAQVWESRSIGQTAALSELAAGLFDELKLFDRKAASLSQAGLANVISKNSALGFKQLNEAIGIYAECGNEFGLTQCIGKKADALAHVGKLDEALKTYKEQYEISDRIGNWEGISNGLGSQSIVLRKMGRHPEAVSIGFRALEIERNTGNLQSNFITLCHLGDSLADDGKISDAIEVFTEQVRVAKEQGIGKNVSHAYDHLAKLASLEKKNDVAIDYLINCVSWSRTSKDPHDAPAALYQLAKFRILVEEQKAIAIENATEAQKLFADIPCPNCLSDVQDFLFENGYTCPLISSVDDE